jgi:hypothetical protein
MTRIAAMVVMTLGMAACGNSAAGVAYQPFGDTASDTVADAVGTPDTVSETAADVEADLGPGPDAADDAAPDAEPDTSPDVEPDTTTDTGPDTSNLADPSGTWAQWTLTSSLTQVPVVGQATSTAGAILLLQVTGQGATAGVTGKVCTLELTSGTTLVQTIAPKAFIDSVEYVSRTVAITATGGQTQLAFPQVYEVRGAKLTDVATEALPTTADDPRVFDQDKDGKPGVTVQIKGLLDGQIWLVQRGWQQGTCDLKDKTCDGLLQWGDEQKILGTDNPILKNPNPSQVHPDATKSFFRSTRVDPGATCADILAQRDKLFAR